MKDAVTLPHSSGLQASKPASPAQPFELSVHPTCLRALHDLSIYLVPVEWR